MGLKKSEIELDNPEKVYFPGQAVTGQLHIVITNKPKLIVQPGIGLQFCGDAKVNFSPPGSSHNDTYSEDNTFFQFTETFMAPPAGGVPLVLPVGDHKFPFSFPLPANIPSSYEGRYGRVQYQIISVISYLTGNKVCNQFHGGRPCNGPHTITDLKLCDFDVNSLVDLNTIPQAGMSASSTDSKTLGFWCCKSGPITAKTWINQVGYAPGQTLYFNAQVENTSRKDMRGSQVQLVEDSIFKCNGATKKVTRVISEKKHGPFNDSDDWSMEPFLIPFVAPSTLPDCKIIDVNYRIQLVIDDGGFLAKKNLTLSMPILIGSIPLRTIEPSSSDGSVVGPAMTQLSLGNDFNNRKLKASSITDYPNLPKPRYEKSHVFSCNGESDSTSKYVSYAL